MATVAGVCRFFMCVCSLLLGGSGGSPFKEKSRQVLDGSTLWLWWWLWLPNGCSGQCAWPVWFCRGFSGFCSALFPKCGLAQHRPGMALTGQPVCFVLSNEASTLQPCQCLATLPVGEAQRAGQTRHGPASTGATVAPAAPEKQTHDGDVHLLQLACVQELGGVPQWLVFFHVCAHFSVSG